MKNMKVALPILWVFMVLNYLYCDVLGLFDPSILRETLQGHAGGGAIQVTPEFLLASAVLMEIPMAMVPLARVLPFRVNRWANILAAGFMTVVQIASLSVTTPAGYYMFFSVVEVATLVLIASLALRWARPATVVTRAAAAATA